MNKLLSTTVVSAFLAASAISMAMAQSAPSSNAPPPPGYGHGHADRAFSRPTERVEARLAYIKTALKITDAQQSQWEAYAAVVRKNAKDREQWIEKRRSREPGQPRPNAIERLEKAQAFFTEMASRVNQLLAVQKPLYAVLSPEQQKVADVVLNPRRRPMGPQMHGYGGFHRG
jgi:protein CpxP